MSQSIKDSRYKLQLKTPAAWWKNMWREALPSGNGKLAASVYGAVSDEHILLSHERLWHWGQKDNVPDVSYTLTETRALMDQKQFNEASWHLTNSLKEQGYNSRLAARFPLAALTIKQQANQAFKHYRRMLDMETGEVQVSWQDGSHQLKRSLFVSRESDTIFMEISSTEPTLDCLFKLDLHPTDSPRLIEAINEMKESVRTYTNGSYLYYSAKNDDDTEYGAVLRVVGGQGEVQAGGDHLHVTGSSKITVMIKCFVQSEARLQWPQLEKELAQLDEEYQQHLQAHSILHQPLFHRANVKLSPASTEWSNEELLLQAYDGEAPLELVERLWAFGRYLFISGTHEQGLPFGLYGLWGGDYDLIWCHNMANENIQMMYWHAAVGGYTSYLPSLMNYYIDMMDDFRVNAKHLYGCRGIYIPAGTTPGIGVPNQIVPVIMNWTGAAAWLASHFYEYYMYTEDKEALASEILPFMVEIIHFYEDFLVDDEDGSIKIFPSVSPENTPVNFMPTDGKPLAHPMPTTINATMDFALLKELLTNLIEGSEMTELYSDQLDHWRKLLQRIPEYKLNDHFAITEWMDEQFEDRYEHRHLSHIYPLFPGREVTIESHPQSFHAFEKAVELRELGAQTGWSLAHMAAIYARLHNGNKALECIDILTRSCLSSNLMTLHNDWRGMGIALDMKYAPMQLDANLGLVHAIQEMLFFSSAKLLKLLPALPDRWNDGSVTDFHFPGGKASFSWNVQSGQFEAVLSANRDVQFTLKLPNFGKQYYFNDTASEQQTHIYGEHYYDISLRANENLQIRAKAN